MSFLSVSLEECNRSQSVTFYWEAVESAYVSNSSSYGSGAQSDLLLCWAKALVPA